MATVDAGASEAPAINTRILNLRNIGVTAHIDAGKTTFSERILYYTGREHKMGDVHEGNTVMDYDPEERARGITITAAATSCEWNCQRLNKVFEINLIDTPGHVDFTAEVERSLRVLDGAIVVFSGVDGVEAQSETVWRQADRYGVPRICFINKMDRVGADYWDCVLQVKTRLGAKGYPIQFPVGKEDDFRGVVDLVYMRQYTFDKASQGKKFTDTDIAPELMDEAKQRREELFHLIADADDEMGAVLLDGKEPENDQLRDALRRITLTGKHFPIMCGSAYHYIGVQPVLDGVAFYLPSPNEKIWPVGIVPGKKKMEKVLNEETAEEEEKQVDVTEVRKPFETEPFAGLAFKTLYDKHGDLTFVRVYSGTLKGGDRIDNPRRSKREKCGQLYRMHADQRAKVDSAGPGDIVAVGGLKFTYTGDTLCSEDRPIILEAMKFPETVISMAIEPKSNADKDKLAQALAKLSKEDPTFTHTFDNDTGQLIIAGMGELHLEIIKNRMVRDHGVDANVGSPRVSYRETITQSAEAEGKFIQQSGGHGQYAVVRLRLEPFLSDEDDKVTFESEIVGGTVPKEFIKPTEAGIRGAAKGGILGSGYPLINMKATLYDGKFHEVDSSELAFQLAGSLALKEAARKCGPVLLEPIMSLEVVTPEEFMGNIIGDLNSRRAAIHDVSNRGHLKVIHARVPLAEMFRYATDSRSLSQGRATYTMEPYGYEAVPRQKYKDILGDAYTGA